MGVIKYIDAFNEMLDALTAQSRDLQIAYMGANLSKCFVVDVSRDTKIRCT